MTSYITGAESFVEPGLDVVGVYIIHGLSSNRYLAKMPARIHLKPATTHQALLTLTLRSNRHSIRNSCKNVREGYVLQQSNPPENRAKRAKKRVVGRILWKDWWCGAGYNGDV